jgi:sugar phosphate isomerase/epimerase
LENLIARRAVSTWSLHRTLGNFVAEHSAVRGGPCMTLPQVPDGLTLIELIPEIANRGYAMVQICHFHLQSRDSAYLAKVKSVLETHNVQLEMLLIDAGDLMDPDRSTQMDWYSGWLEAATLLGAERARICAGRSAPTPERLTSSGAMLAELARNHPAVKIVTENWMEATPDAASVLAVLDAAGPEVGLLIDLANWAPPEKYRELELIAPRAISCHAKCGFSEAGTEADDFRQTLSILKRAGFAGPISLIYDGPDPDEWSGLDFEWEIVNEIFLSEF